MLTGITLSNSGLATPGAYKTVYSGEGDSFFSRFDANGNRIWTSYYGGSGVELTHGCLQWDEEYFYLWGTSYSLDHIASNDGFQPFLHTDNPLQPTMNGYLAKFKTTTLSVADFEKIDLACYPNPNNGVFTIRGHVPDHFQSMEVIVYDNLGRKIANEKITPANGLVNQTFDFRATVSTGVYLAQITADGKPAESLKLIVQ